MRHELKQLGIGETAAAYRSAWNSVSTETGIKQPFRGLDVARRFIKDTAKDNSGILVDLAVMHSIVGVVPRSMAFITDPVTAAALLRHEDFASLSSDHPTYQAFKPYVGEYIVFKYTKDEWLEDRKAAALPFSRQEMNRELSEQVSKDAIDSVMGLASNESLPGNWIKYLTSYQVVKQVTGHEVAPKILSDAVNAHTAFTGKTLREIMVGSMPKSVGKIISYPTLRNYHRLKREIAGNDPDGIVKHVLENLPEHRRDMDDVSASLIGGLSTLRSFMENIFYVLAKNPNLQDAALKDPSVIRRVMQETGRKYPAAPYILRKTTKDIRLGDTTIPKDSLVVFGIFAYGVNPEIADPDNFDPNREGLEEMFTNQGGAANVFSYGPRACLGKYLGEEILETTAKLMVERYQIYCLNNPILMIGKGIGSRFDKPPEFRLTDRKTGITTIATSK
ncbi:MAG: cytochrome P450 [Candidatus Levybacteria bacterium]|nr:cytochrome P450 [Candidatus Levybacteria bacterium]